ncbi:glycosyltransferase [Falsirhodobacter sp. 20TX0035]|uniref:glycosyltransferase n=1 Tax=Falsirhodobacter sp. 20TX0035 TaxID=3022019 RepID=UPI00232CB999|nr:glycosyltransferase [Falsirhodobacter sp. 20TX0035]MDB6454761.1 glycosyltransferase [Falsirhodobacter sp. 20TX0035]
MADFYFQRFEDRRPPAPLPYSMWREMAWQFLATLALVIGAWYIHWRWTQSLNWDALWFAIPLVLAETLAYVGLILFVINLWRDQPVVLPDPPALVEDTDPATPEPGRAIAVDVLFATYNEDPDLVRLGIRDAKAITYPHPIDIRIHVLDDGRRSEMRAVCEEEGVGYITRSTNEGYKAGNLRNAMERTSGDFIVICDADTRPFPTILQHTLGHFRDPRVAWVQTPQWFYDLPEGETLTQRLGRRLGRLGRWTGRAVESVTGTIAFGADPFVSDPQMFYDVILRRRNWANAAFCCGAGSIHRREAVMEAALRSFGASVERRVIQTEEEVTLASRERSVAPELMAAIRTEAVVAEVLTPYRFHVSEDIYTSIVLHSDRERGWKSVLHPTIESKMLSPQDLLSWTIQRFKYAGGSLDILFHDNPLFRRGLTLPQRLMYGSTFWSYLGSIWNVIFLLAPAIYLFTGIAPVSAYTADFFVHVIPFLVMLELAMMMGTWGIAGYASKTSYLAFFPIGLKALWAVARGQKISFPVTPKDRQSGTFLRLVRPQIAVIVLTAVSAVWAVTWLLLGHGSWSVTGVVTNILWGINNCLAMAGMIRAALWNPEPEPTTVTETEEITA